MYVRSSSVVAFAIGDYYYLGYGSIQKAFKNETYSQIKLLLDYLSSPKSIEDIQDFIKRKSISEEVFEICKENNYILDGMFFMNNNPESVDYKNILYLESAFKNSDKIIERIRNSVLVNIGCGGIGNYLMYAYASFVPKKIIMIDGDRVSMSNLNRQILFKNSDVGLFKADVIKRELSCRFSEVEYATINEFVTPKLLLDLIDQNKTESDIIITISGDNDNTVKDCISVAAKVGVPCLNIGYLNDYSVIGPFFIPGKTACMFCEDVGSDYVENKYDELKAFNSFYRAPSSYMNSSMAASMAMIDILHYYSGDLSKINSANQRIGIRNLDFGLERIRIKRNDNCSVCGKNNQ